MKDDYLKKVTSLIGLLVALGALAGFVQSWSNQPQLLQIVALLGYIIFSGGMIWFALNSQAKQQWRWLSLIVLYVTTIVFFLWIGAHLSANVSTTTASSIESKYLPIETIPMDFFCYSDEIDKHVTGKGWGRLIIRTENARAGYVLEYSIPDTGDGYAGLSFTFSSDQDLTEFEFIVFTINFGDNQARTNLYMKDIAKSGNIVPLGVGIPIAQGATVNTNGSDQTFKIPIATNFSSLNRKVVREIGFNSDQGTSRGWHTFKVSDVKFVKR
jgi:hypothetical protein